MLQSLLVGTEYCFVPGIGVSDWFELHEKTVREKLDGLAHVHNKQGGLIRVLILGEQSLVKRADILQKVEDATGLVYVRSQEVKLSPEYSNTLKRLYGDKAVTTRSKRNIRIVPSNVYLVEINKPIALMPLDKYVQWASKGPGERFFVSRGGRGSLSISVKSVTVLAQRIMYYDDDNQVFIEPEGPEENIYK